MKATSNSNVLVCPGSIPDITLEIKSKEIAFHYFLCSLPNIILPSIVACVM